MINRKKSRTLNKINLLNCIYLIPVSAFAASNSPWQVNDGSTLNVTSSYRATQQGDYELYSYGEGSKLVSTSPGLVFSSSFASTNVAQALKGGQISLTDALLQSTGASSSVLLAQGGTVDITGGSLISNGSGTSYGINAQSSSDITLNGLDLTYTSGGSGSAIALASSDLNATGVTITSNGNSAVLVNRGSNASFDNSKINAQGTATGIASTGSNANVLAQVTLTDSKVTTENATGIRGVYSDITLNNTDVETHGDAAHALDVNVGTQMAVTGGTFQTSGSKSFGAWVIDSASSLTAQDASFTTTGEGAHAIAAQKGSATLTDTVLTTSGNDAYGLYSEATVTGSGLTINTYGNQGIGTMAARGGSVALSDSTITTHSDGAAGALAYPQSTVNLDNVAITTYGDNAYGLWDYAGTISASDSTITTLGNSAALYANGYSETLSNSVSLNNVQLTSENAQAVSAETTTLNLDLQDSILTGGNQQSITVQSTQDDDASYYSTVAVSAKNSVLNGDIISDSDQNQVDITLADSSVLNGATQSISSLNVDSTSAWNVSGDSTLASLTNNGTVNFSSDGQARTIVVSGNYAGDGGTLVMNTVLGDDSSQTDKLVVLGDVEAGSTATTINNLGGSGAQTVEGIEIVNVAGTSYGEFTKSGRIVAGAYDYDIVKKGESWYLTSSTEEVDPGDNGGGDNGGGDNGGGDNSGGDNGGGDNGGSDNGGGDNGNTGGGDNNNGGGGDNNSGDGDGGDNGSEGGNNGDGGNSGGGSTSRTPVVRPEMGAWLANQQAANTLFMMQLHDREGARYLSNDDQGGGMWLRQVGEHNRFHDNSGQLKTQSNRYTVQIGADLGQWNFTDKDRIYAGMMVGYGHSDSQTHSSVSGYSAKGRVSGYSVGPYATWYQDIATREGAYVDSWMLYNWFDNTVSGQDLARENYTSRGVQASLESGYSVKLTDNGALSSWVQPKAQIVWSNITADDHTEDNGTRVHQQTQSNIMTRLGVRAYLRGHSAYDADTGREFQPFVETSWLHNTHNWSIQMDDATDRIEGSRNIAELKLGVEGHVAPAIDMWGNITQQLGDTGYSSTQAMLGMKYRF